MFQFGSGTVWGYPVGGNTAANPTPIKLGTLQDIAIDISGDIKQLYGQKQFPEAVARGKMKISGKAKFAWIDGKQLNDMFFGQTMAAGMIKAAIDEGPTPIPATPFQITVTNHTTYLNDVNRGDQGVRNAANGLPLVRVAASPAAGQYSVAPATGIYTFSSADNVSGISVLISYLYTPVTTGSQANVLNQLMGFAPTFQILLTEQYGTTAGVPNQLSVLLYNCVAAKLNFATKQEDFLIPELDFEAFANPAGQVIDIYSSE